MESVMIATAAVGFTILYFRSDQFNTQFGAQLVLLNARFYYLTI